MSPSSPARRRAGVLLGVVLALALIAPSWGFEVPAAWPVSPAARGEIEPGVVLARFKASARPERAAGVLAGVGAAEEGEIRPIRVRKLRVPPGREREVAARLSADPDVEFAEVSSILHVLWTPDDPQYPAQWNLPKIGMPQAWDVTRGSPSVVVAVVDTGIDVTHPDRPANLRLGADYVSGGQVSSDPNGHGTHVAGIVAANTNNGQGVAGVAPGVTVLAILVCDFKGDCATSNVASGIVEAADAGAEVVNLSLGGYADQDLATLSGAVSYAQGKGALVVAAAGNDGNSGTPVYPAALPGVLAVGATDINDSLASYSHVGSYVGVVAPGGDSNGYVLSLCPVAQGSYCLKAGTSMATPHVSGLAALILSSRPFLTANRVADIIKSTADQSVSISLGLRIPNDQYGYGRIDAAAALAMTQSIPIFRTHFPLVLN